MFWFWNWTFTFDKLKIKAIWHYWLCQCLSSLQKVGVSLGSDTLQTFLIHQFCCSWNLIDEKSVRKPDDVFSQCDSRNLEKEENTRQWTWLSDKTVMKKGCRGGGSDLPFYRHPAVICKASCPQSWKCGSEAQTDHRWENIYLSGRSPMVHLKTQMDFSGKVS